MVIKKSSGKQMQPVDINAACLNCLLSSECLCVLARLCVCMCVFVCDRAREKERASDRKLTLKGLDG